MRLSHAPRFSALPLTTSICPLPSGSLKTQRLPHEQRSYPLAAWAGTVTPVAMIPAATPAVRAPRRAREEVGRTQFPPGCAMSGARVRACLEHMNVVCMIDTPRPSNAHKSHRASGSPWGRSGPRPASDRSAPVHPGALGGPISDPIACPGRSDDTRAAAASTPWHCFPHGRSESNRRGRIRVPALQLQMQLFDRSPMPHSRGQRSGQTQNIDHLRRRKFRESLFSIAR